MQAPQHLARLAAVALALAPAAAQDSRVWRVELPPSPLGRASASPAIAGERVVVSTSLEVLALDARSGELLWTSERDSRWTSEHWTRLGIDDERSVVAPAVAQGIVVASLLVPRPDEALLWDELGVPLGRVAPERRLHAFDLASGRPLWSHAPTWDGTGGAFAERARVAGPPVVAGSRVLVPCYGLSERTEQLLEQEPVDDYHVACYELATGELVWSTAVARTQPPLDMFGRRFMELATPPLAVAGERAIAVTRCGVVAALRVDTGELSWSTEYERLGRTPAPDWLRGDKPLGLTHWRTAPPVVADGAVIAAPADALRLLAFDLTTGAPLWSEPHVPEADTLLGADRTTIWLGGDRTLVALRKPGGLAGGGALERAWRADLGDAEPGMPRALVTGDAVLVPRSDRIAAFDRTNGERLPDRALAHEPGNLALAGDVLVAQSDVAVVGLGRPLIWSVALPAEPFARLFAHRTRFGAFPAIAQGSVLASDGVELVAVDAGSGAVRWRSELNASWKRAVYRRSALTLDHGRDLVAPLVAGAVVVAALEVPLPDASSNFVYQGAPIRPIVAERRLHAFDLESGRPLWDHRPPADWDATTGSFAVRARVAGSPVAAGSRVLVPCWGLVDRARRGVVDEPLADYHVACYELATGELVWSTLVVVADLSVDLSDVREEALATPPLVVEGERAFAVTSCGVVAALRVDTGELLWSTVYERLPPRRGRGWDPDAGRPHWRVAVPLVVDGAVIATPVDSPHLVAFDVESGARLWAESHPHHADTLLGADRTTIWLAGERELVAWPNPSGLASGDPLRSSRRVDLGGDGTDMPRALLTDAAILVPRADGIAAYDRATLEPLPGLALPWPAGPGSLASAGGVLVTQSSTAVAGLVLGAER